MLGVPSLRKGWNAKGEPRRSDGGSGWVREVGEVVCVVVFVRRRERRGEDVIVAYVKRIEAAVRLGGALVPLVVLANLILQTPERASERANDPKRSKPGERCVAQTNNA